MNIRKAVKKIAALGTGVTLLGATMFGAAAADLSDYPSPLFVKNGTFDGVIVVGNAAASSDVIGSVDIATTLQASSVSKTAVSTSGKSATVTVEGDAVKIAKSTDPLNYDQQLNTPISTLTASDLDSLAEGSIRNNKGTFKYNQYITMPTSASVVYDKDPDRDDPAFYLKIPSTSVVYEYRVTFPTALKSDVDANSKLKDLDSKKITLLGKEYTIMNTLVTGAAGGQTLYMELLSGAIEDTLEEYTSKTYTFNGVDYEVELVGLSDSGSVHVIMKVNGEVSDKLGEGQTYKLSDGTEIGVKSIFITDPARKSPSFAEFYLGASKIVLEESSNSDWAGLAGTDTVEYKADDTYAVVDFTGTDSTTAISGTVEISEIGISWTTSEDFFVPVGEALSGQLESDVKGNLFAENIDFKFAGVESAAADEIKLNPSSTKLRMTVNTKTSDSFTYDAMYAYDNGARAYELGTDATKKIVGTAATAGDVDVDLREKVWLSSDKYSHLIEIDRVESDKVRFKNVASGATQEVTVASGGAIGSLILDGKEYKFSHDGTGTVKFETGKDGSNDLNALGTDYHQTGVNTLTTGVVAGDALFYTKEEARVLLSGPVTATTTTIEIYEKELSDNNAVTDYDEGISIPVSAETFVIGSGNDKIEVTSDPTVVPSNAVAGYVAVETWDSKDSWQTGTTMYGTSFEQATDNEGKITLQYPKEEVSFAVYATSGVTKVSEAATGADGEAVTETVNPIAVGTAKLDTEISSVSAQNMIVVGGPCANSVAAQLMGNPDPCYEGFEEGKAIIKLYENGGKVAMLVAGATALDTRRASRVLAEYDQYSLSGMETEVVGTSTTFSDTVVRAPTSE
jgi:hypothetical protein